jgi:HAD superfamily hydrolase (TIGR01490 family)
MKSPILTSSSSAMKVAAFFDLDCTLVACNTGRLFLRDLRRRGEISLAKALRALSWLAKYRLAIVDLPTITAHVADFLRGKKEDDFAEQCQRLVEDEVLPRLLPAGLRAVERHRDNGHILALLSSSPRYIVEPVARALSVQAVGATEFEVQSGKLTGQLRGPACFGSGKVHWAESLGRSHAIDVGASWFYTDSFTDLPMLERVTHRVAVNPDPRLKKTARSRGWPVEDWMSSLLPRSAVV